MQTNAIFSLFKLKIVMKYRVLLEQDEDGVFVAIVPPAFPVAFLKEQAAKRLSTT